MFKIALIDSHLIKKGDFLEIKQLCEDAGGEFLLLECKTNDEIVAQAGDADALLVVYSSVNKSLLERLPKCKIAVRLGIGVDNYNLPDFTDLGIVAANVPDYGVEEVAAHTMGMILAAERKIPYFEKKVRDGIWNDGEGYPMRRLSERTLGFFGFGRIAQKLSQCCAPFNYKMIAFDPYLPDAVFEKFNVEKVSVEELFLQVNTLALMAPLTKETKHILNDDTLAIVQEGLRVVNTARGELVDTDALVRALESGKVAAAGLDVLDGEPLTDPAHPLLKFDSVFLTPHTAYQTVESIAVLKRMAMETALDFLTGQPARNVVNPDVLKKLN